MTLSHHFKSSKPKTVQLVLSGGGAWCAYEAAILSIITPFILERGYDIELVTGVSGGIINSTILSAALNADRAYDIPKLLRDIWTDIGHTGDFYLKTALTFSALHDQFNYFASADNKFPNIPSHLMLMGSFAGKSSLPIDHTRKLLKKHLPEESWGHIRNGKTKIFIGTLRVEGDIRHPEILTGQDLSIDAVLAGIAMRQNAAYMYKGHVHEDYAYHEIGHIEDHPTDILFAIGLSPLRNVSEIENKYGIKSGQLHHDLAKFYMKSGHKTHIDFICLDPPAYWNETSSMNNTSRNIDALWEMGLKDAVDWIAKHGETFGKKSSYQPTSEILNFNHFPAPMAA